MHVSTYAPTPTHPHTQNTNKATHLHESREGLDARQGGGDGVLRLLLPPLRGRAQSRLLCACVRVHRGCSDAALYGSHPRYVYGVSWGGGKVCVSTMLAPQPGSLTTSRSSSMLTRRLQGRLTPAQLSKESDEARRPQLTDGYHCSAFATHTSTPSRLPPPRRTGVRRPSSTQSPVRVEMTADSTPGARQKWRARILSQGRPCAVPAGYVPSRLGPTMQEAGDLQTA
jgi:hypothetical protein